MKILGDQIIKIFYYTLLIIEGRITQSVHQWAMGWMTEVQFLGRARHSSYPHSIQPSYTVSSVPYPM
jgi:hypothetical protein